MSGIETVVLAQLEAAARSWLAEKNTTVWWDWDIKDEKELRVAARKWVQEYRSFAEFLVTRPFFAGGPLSPTWGPPTIEQHEGARYFHSGTLLGPSDRNLPGTRADDPEWISALQQLREKGILP